MCMTPKTSCQNKIKCCLGSLKSQLSFQGDVLVEGEVCGITYILVAVLILLVSKCHEYSDILLRLARLHKFKVHLKRSPGDCIFFKG